MVRCKRLSGIGNDVDDYDADRVPATSDAFPAVAVNLDRGRHSTQIVQPAYRPSCAGVNGGISTASPAVLLSPKLVC